MITQQQIEELAGNEKLGAFIFQLLPPAIVAGWRPRSDQLTVLQNLLSSIVRTEAQFQKLPGFADTVRHVLGIVLQEPETLTPQESEDDGRPSYNSE